MDAQLCVKKPNRTGILLWKCQSTVRAFLTVHNNNNDITTCIYIYLYKIFWFYFSCIKISPRQTNSSRSLASTLNLTCANDVTCSYDVIMRKRQVLNLTLTLRVPRFNLRPKKMSYVKCVPIFSCKGYLVLRLTQV